MKQLFEIINQVTSLESKLGGQEEYQRHFSRCRQSFEEMGMTYYAPLGEKYSETRTDVSASIVGESTKDLVITKVIKPVIVQAGQIVQQGIVIVEGN